MQVSVERESPELIKVEVSGRVESGQWQAALKDVARLLKPGERTSVLVAAEGFEGWEPGGWDDLSFQRDHDAQIGRMAIVVDPKWRDQAMMFAGKGLRRLEMEYFDPADLPQARQWLTSPSA